ncbi:MAG: hypothetical protein LBT43_13640 [Prevotella sp.]|jgi:hypothetical protein|nr:hypothetical protein [Prevotella sp.]
MNYYLIKFILSAIFILCGYNIKITAQERNEIIPLDLNKDIPAIPDIKNSGNEFIQPIFSIKIDNSLSTSQLYGNGIDNINYRSLYVNNFSPFSASSVYNYGFEGATSVSFGINWNINSKLKLTGRPFLTSYYFGPADYNRNISIGSDVVLTYKANDWLILRAFGQYAYNGLSSPDATSLIVPQNCFGGEVLVKFSNVFGLGGGVKYINNKGRWTPQFYTIPIIKIDGSKLLKKH